MAPCLDTGAADADGYVALEHYAILMGIVDRTLELQVQMVLDEKVDGSRHLIVVFIVYAIVAPLRVVGRAVLITQVAVGSIGTQPRLVVLIETLERC